jgi:hypothetical protein
LITASGQILSLIALLAVCMVMRLAVPAPTLVFYAAVGGFEGALALAAFYRALAMGAMGLTAALTGLLTALLPVLFTLVHDGLPCSADCPRTGGWMRCHLAHHKHYLCPGRGDPAGGAVARRPCRHGLWRATGSL